MSNRSKRTTIAQLGGFLSPWAIGYLRDATGTYTAGLLGISAVSFIGVALVFIFSQSLNRAISPQASRAGAD